MIDGTRLNIAREACFLTQAALSDLSGVPASTISKIEKGLYGPNTDKYAKQLAKALDTPVSFLLGGETPYVPDGRYRKQSKASAKLTKSVVAHARQIAIVMAEADRRYRIHATTIKPLEGVDVESGGFDLDVHASKIRDMLGVGQEGPIKNMTRACERAGIAVVSLPLFDSDAGQKERRAFSGFSTWPGMGVGGSRPIMVLSSSLPGDVQRASVAHELGHVYAHTRNPGIDDDFAEKQAWALGDRVLVPLADLKGCLGDRPVTLERLKRIKAVYGVSVKLLITYCSHAGIIDAEKTESLNKQYSTRKWHKSEPVEVCRETEVLVPSVIRRMRKDGLDIGMRQIEVSRMALEGEKQKADRPAGGVVIKLGR